MLCHLDWTFVLLTTLYDVVCSDQRGFQARILRTQRCSGKFAMRDANYQCVLPADIGHQQLEYNGFQIWSEKIFVRILEICELPGSTSRTSLGEQILHSSPRHGRPGRSLFQQPPLQYFTAGISWAPTLISGSSNAKTLFRLFPDDAIFISSWKFCIYRLIATLFLLLTSCAPKSAAPRHTPEK